MRKTARHIYWLVLGLFYILIGWPQETTGQTAHNTINALTSNADVLAFIQPLGWEFAEAMLGDSAVVAYKPYAHTKWAVHGTHTWFKTDFDQNGLTDLLVLARRKEIPLVFCVLDLGNNEFKVVRNFYDAVHHRSPVARVRHHHGQNLLEYVDFARSRGNHGQLRGRRRQRLSYVAGGFIPYKARPAQYQLRKLDLQAHSVYHDIVTTKIQVVGDSIWGYQRKQGVLDTARVSKRVYRGQLTNRQRIELNVLLGYLSLKNSEQQYGQSRLNHHTRVDLKIEYNSQKQVTIKDLNGIGSLALRRLYMLLWDAAGLL